MIDKLSAKEKIESLVTRFGEQYDSYRNSDYNETQTRRDFIDPFFKALGWDMDNEEGYAEAYREVINEDKVRISGATKAPDYSFRYGGKRLFFVEAKKPSISVKEDIQPAYQVRRYGWSAKLPISIISNFEEFAIYDCTKKPYTTDKSSVARIKYLTFRDYFKEFDFIWDTFSKEQVLKGSFDKFVQSDTYKKGTATVDKDFLETLDRWRTYLAANISWNNKNLDEDEINFVVQQTIDRLIFLRIAEDRSVEPYGNLKHALKQGNLYSNLYELFRKADEKYNSGLFDFKKDQISETITIENKIIKTIINELYYPECPYEFSVLSVEILGSAYEQFLGKVIRITTGHRAKIEEKPEVRKAGGVYYTPQYIVDYIVKNTVGKLIEGKTPKEISKIKIVDPACGSGSFLIGAFQYLLEYHKNYYSDNGKPSKGKKDNSLTPDGHLTTAEKKRILLNNIFGVDLDVNAVEVTKLSLLIKCLEGETETSIQQQFKLWNERVLPTLDENIKDGNSLIDIDFYSSLLDLGFEKKIKPFSWINAFPNVFKQQGFDIVIGNPPYGAEFTDEEKKYLLNKYKHQNYQLDSYLVFLEQSVSHILKIKGKFGMIIPNPWLTNLLQKNLRRFILEKTQVDEIVHFKQAVFPHVTVDTEIVLLTNIASGINRIKITLVEKGTPLLNNKHSEIFHRQKDWVELDGDVINIFLKDSEKKLFNKILNKTVPLETYFKINVGIKPYQTGKGKPPQTREDVDNRIFDADNKIDKDYRLYLRGSDINRYTISPQRIRYLKFGDWLAEPRLSANFDAPEKIFMRQTGDSLVATIDTNKYLCLNNMHVLVPSIETKFKISFFLGLINSKLLNWYYQAMNPEKGEALAEVKKTNVAKLPIKTIDLSFKPEKETYNELVKCVDNLIELKAQLILNKLQTKINQINSKITYCDNRIDELVFQLYDLSDDEIKIVEGNESV
jgi:type I restriction-modification system DNA methylase subunit